MGKIALAVLVIALGLGVFWFWWSDQGANNPVTIEATFSVSGLPAIPGMKGPIEGNLTLYVTSNKVKISQDMKDQKVSTIIRFDKREMYILDDKNRKYATQEFDLVDTDQTEKKETGDETWSGELKRTAEWDYIGREDEKRFCNKQTFSGNPADMAAGAGTLPGMEGLSAMSKIPGGSNKVTAELWFTQDTRCGRRLFGVFNKLMRLREVGSGIDQKDKRPQYKYTNLDFFPIPMRANFSLGSISMQMEVKSLSRKKIDKTNFEIPSNYTKTNLQDIGKAS
jgi:hypothetical protein